MRQKTGLLQVLFLIGLTLLVAGCATSHQIIVNPIDPRYYPTSTGTPTNTSTPFVALTDTPIVLPPTSTPTATDTRLPTNTPSPTDTPVQTSTPELVWNPGGQVIAPILLYHHVSNDGNGNQYYVSIEAFRAQMEALHDWGYTSITVTELVNVLIHGGNLPNRPVLITFDDGFLDVYQHAFPIMHELGFIGTTYIVADRLQYTYFLDVEQIQEMADDGWEIGSHSMTHTDLTTDYSITNFEIGQSLLTLEDATGEPVNSFAYPYGKTDDFVSTKVTDYGYSSGMGLGASYQHSLDTLFYLSRMEIQGEYDMAKFVSMLPWSGN